GGGTYGVVWSVTVKAHPDAPVTTLAFLNFTSDGVSADTYWNALQSYLSISPNLTDAGLVSSALLNSRLFKISPLAAFNKTATEVAALIDPLLKSLDEHGVKYQHSIESHTNYLDAFHNLHDLGNIGTALIGGWMMPRSVWEDQNDFQAFAKAVRDILDDGGSVIGFAMRPTLQASGNRDNAVLPAWRDVEQSIITARALVDGESLEDINKDQIKISHVYDAALKKVAPQSGTYMNEGDSNEPDFKQAFYGANYDRLLAIKDKWDPDQLLYGSVSVGGDRWYQTEEGRLCRVSKSTGVSKNSTTCRMENRWFESSCIPYDDYSRP
ncbi:hypothetical protein V5O48_008488, partial [Marasmius crinis-equi]